MKEIKVKDLKPGNLYFDAIDDTFYAVSRVWGVKNPNLSVRSSDIIFIDFLGEKHPLQTTFFDNDLICIADDEDIENIKKCVISENNEERLEQVGNNMNMNAIENELNLKPHIHWHNWETLDELLSLERPIEDLIEQLQTKIDEGYSKVRSNEGCYWFSKEESPELYKERLSKIKVNFLIKGKIVLQSNAWELKTLPQIGNSITLYIKNEDDSPIYTHCMPKAYAVQNLKIENEMDYKIEKGEMCRFPSGETTINIGIELVGMKKVPQLTLTHSNKV
jgi:hypothetical protein